jgi:hypothetical protein
MHKRRKCLLDKLNYISLRLSIQNFNTERTHTQLTNYITNYVQLSATQEAINV